MTIVGGGYESQYAVSVDNKGKHSLWGWGRNFGMEIGQQPGSRGTCYTRPHRMTQYDAIADKIVYVNGGYGMVAVLLDDGRVFGSGWANHLGLTNKETGAFRRGEHVGDPNPRQIMGAGTSYPNVKRLIVRYLGAIAVPEDEADAIYTWGRWWEGSYRQVYGRSPTRRQLNGNLKELGTIKEAIFYTNEQNELYGVGYNEQATTNICERYVITWDRSRARYYVNESVMWYNRNPDTGEIFHGGRRVPYEMAVDELIGNYCDNRQGSGVNKNLDGLRVREWTPFEDDRMGRRPGYFGIPLHGGEGCVNDDSGQC